ncbi:hypothetical protein SS05631_c31990 [Sinorhizobium sp. CCBAU 05631]|nr:hypothetical protein SS05631_c31990 [Sinorhizobium sp. CCBAU 05631]
MSVNGTLPAKSEQNKNITQKRHPPKEKRRRGLGAKKLEPTLRSINFS